MHIQQLLSKSGIRFQKFPYGPAGGVFLTAANQLVGSLADLRRFQAGNRDYLRWQPQQLVPHDVLGKDWVPPEQQPCVLLPEKAPVDRINNVLRRAAAAGATPSASDLQRAYGEAFALAGNYCGGGASAIRQELQAIVNATFRVAGLA